MGLPGGKAVGEEGVEARAWRDERLALDADVVSVGKPRICHQTRGTLRGDRKHTPGRFAGSDQVAREAPERRWRHDDTALYPGRAAGDRVHAAGRSRSRRLWYWSLR